MLDLGTGDGTAVLKAARADAWGLAIGVDTELSRLREASRRARALPNTLFLLGDAREALATLEARIDEVRISLPWGSLLRLVLEGDADFAHAVAGSL